MGKPENELTKQAVDYISHNGFKWHWRNQVLKGMFKGYHVNQGKSGIGDYVVIFPDGRTCYIEIKLPGKKRTPEQIEFAAYCIANSVPYVFVQKISDLTGYFKQYFRGTQWENRFFY